MARSTAYPSSTIVESFDFTSKIFEGFGKKDFIKTDAIASYLEKSADTLKGLFSSSVQYGLLTMKKKHGYVPSPLFHIIKYPHSSEEKRKSEIQCFNSPPLYRNIITKYNNEKLPIGQALKSLLIRDYKITEAASDKALKVFETNYKYLNLVDELGILRVSGAIKQENDNGEQEDDFDSDIDGDGNNNGNGANKDLRKNKGKREPIIVFLDDNRSAEIKVPVELYEDDLEYIIDVLKINLKRLLKKKEVT